MDLNSPVGTIPNIGPIYRTRLEKLGIETVEDLLLHIPFRYEDYSEIVPVKSARVGDTVTLQGTLTFIKNQYTKSGKIIQLGELADNSGSILLMWFNQRYLIQTLHKNDHLSVSGKIEWYGHEKALISPEYEIMYDAGSTVHTGRIVPIYPETAGISSKWLRARFNYVKQNVGIENLIEEFLSPDFLGKNDLMLYDSAVTKAHYPIDLIEPVKARERLAFNELFFLHLANFYKKTEWDQNKLVYSIKLDKKIANEFIQSLPFKLTASQERSISEILCDLNKNTPMNRLLEGDVGSGKTVVAAFAAFALFTKGLQTVFMAPTQILAHQHFETLQKLLEPFKFRISLVTSDEKVADLGRSDIFVGTHALIHAKVPFDKVALVVIDEQHRFGVEQRAHLTKITGGESYAPHVLTMTATPIPRTIALTFYGDLDLSTLDELPKGRQQITTWVVPPIKRKGAYGWITEQIKKEGIQVFIVCPLIEESEIETMKTVKAVTREFEDLKKIFPQFKLGLLHGRLKPDEKNQALSDFKEGKINILVSTPVVEVGIDIPNATIMLIEAAERFGLSQLHQLRGRVGRGSKKSYCLLFSESRQPKVTQRLKAMTEAHSGFELAELDLKMRGPGEIFGVKQHGFPELKIANWQDIDLIKKSRDLASAVFSQPKKYQEIIKMLKEKQKINN